VGHRGWPRPPHLTGTPSPARTAAYVAPVDIRGALMESRTVVSVRSAGVVERSHHRARLTADSGQCARHGLVVGERVGEPDQAADDWLLLGEIDVQDALRAIDGLGVERGVPVAVPHPSVVTVEVQRADVVSDDGAVLGGVCCTSE
jgi:hypothetical protein